MSTEISTELVCPDVYQWLCHLLEEVDSVTHKPRYQRRQRLDIAADALPALLALLQGKGSFVHLSAISCVDWINEGEFELVYHVWSYELKVMVSAHIRIPREPGRYLSVYDIYKPAGFFERDIFEMYGILFEGSPWMEKFILTEWDGPPPMRKEFDSEGWVNDHFDWQDYHPDWLNDLEGQGGGIAIRPEEQRFSRKAKDES
jgi:NADH-quinone oxidoreductase subunit C